MKVTNKMMTGVVVGILVATGTYNSVVINSASDIAGNEVTFVMRLDEVYGVTVPGRQVAASLTWKKLGPSQIMRPIQVIQPLSTVASAPSVPEGSAPDPAAAVQEELNLSLVEVINTRKWQNGLTNTQFSGSLSTNGGVIEGLSVSLPNGEGLSVSFSEMTGNVFEYDINGELYSGMMYQVDQNAYMITLTNGPLEGTRLRFSSQAPVEGQQQDQDVLASNNVDVGSFGAQPTPDQVNPEAILDQDQQLQQEAIQAQGFNLNNSQPL
jgi:hypothetical protein